MSANTQGGDGNDSDDGGLYGLFVSEEYTEQTWRFDSHEQKLLCSTAAMTDHDLTGQIVWPASVFLGWFVHKHAEECFANKLVIELGAGAGLGGFVAASSGARHTIITDGNEIVTRLIKKNKVYLDLSNVSVEQLLWGEKESIYNMLEKDKIEIEEPRIIIGADVILWPDMIQPLLLTIYWLLCDNPSQSICYISYVLRVTSTTDRLFETAQRIGLKIEDTLPSGFLTEEAINDMGPAEKHLFTITIDTSAEEGGVHPGREAVMEEYFNRNAHYAYATAC
jgi:hypothetical protein